MERDCVCARLTLAVAVAGCASTVGVGALTAATHVDWSELVVGEKGLGIGMKW